MRQPEIISVSRSWVLIGCLLQVLAGCGSAAVPAATGGTQAPGTIDLNQAAPRDTLVGGGGGGTVAFNGKVYHFAIGGLGVDGSAVAILATTGEVYRLDNIAQFPGTYRQANADAPRPSQDSSGLFIQNEHGVVIHLEAPPQGQVPALHDDAVRVILD